MEAERLGIPSLIALGNQLMGESLRASQPDAALEAFQRAKEMADDVSCRLVMGLALLGASATLVQLGRLREAAQGHREAILHWRWLGNVTLQWNTLRSAANLLARSNGNETATRILAAADADDRASQPPTKLPDIVEETLVALDAIAPPQPD